MSYTQLPIIEVGLDKLRLDLDNYRIPTHRDDEAAALSYLFASENVLGQASLIIRNGYFDNEIPIVATDPSGYVVLEGNRRVSALKALREPSLVPGHEREVRALLKRYAVEAENLPYAIRVMVAPDRATAAPHIARLHTGLSKRGWSPDQQATYYFSLLGPDMTVDDIKARYPGVPVVRLIKMAVMRRFLLGVRFSDASLHAFASGPDLTMSAFEYAYRHRDIAHTFGVVFDRNGFLTPHTTPPGRIAANLSDRERAAVEYLASEFRANRLNTRSLQFKKDTCEKNRLLDILRGGTSAPLGSTPDTPTEVSSGSAATTVEPKRAGIVGNPSGSARFVQPEKAQDVPKPVRGPNHPNTRDTLEMGGVDYTTHSSVNLQSRYHELRRISLTDLPAAAAMLLRSVLETTIKFHFESTDTPVTGELNAVFKQVAASYGREKPLQNAISTIQSGPATKPGSVQWFNLASHSADSLILADDVRQAWHLLNPVIRRLLRPAAQ